MSYMLCVAAAVADKCAGKGRRLAQSGSSGGNQLAIEHERARVWCDFAWLNSCSSISSWLASECHWTGRHPTRAGPGRAGRDEGQSGECIGHRREATTATRKSIFCWQNRQIRGFGKRRRLLHVLPLLLMTMAIVVLVHYMNCFVL